MKEINITELRSIQLSILCDVDKYCRDNNINYSLAGGTLIGCIRHKGYIPWDDDIDIYMLRDDYERFISSYNNQRKNTRVASLNTDERYDLAYAKIEDSRTIMIENVDNVNNCGVNIDLFPLDGVPNSTKDRRKYVNKLIRLYNLSLLKNVSTDWQNRSLIKNVILLISKIFLQYSSMRGLAQKLDASIDKSLNTTTMVSSLTCGNPVTMCFNRKCMQKFREMSFEGKNFMVMDGFHDYLTNAYGDYMKLPPLEQQKSHHAFSAWWKDS